MGCCGLTRYGRREIFGATAATILLCAGIAAVACWVSPWAAVAEVLPAAVYAWVLAFFRDPERTPPAGEHLLVSPADGRVADITQVGPDSLLGLNGVKVGVFMNVFNVHVNRIPATGSIERVEHRPGAFLDVRDPMASERNESTTITMTHERDGAEYPIVFRQIAGLVARRIVTDLTKGQSVSRGERMGMIKFGSRLELFVPAELVGEVRVSIGEFVRAGETVLIAGPEGQDDGTDADN